MRCFLAAWMVLGLVCPSFADPMATAVSSQPVHPMLIRNEHGPLTRVVVEVAKGVEAQLKSFDFTLDGTDDLGHLESLTLFSTGDKDEFSPALRERRERTCPHCCL